eukprot:TRINITY_DN243_c0_g1_i1.p1 TRINITY_DN243_c0_g1~~TRINITY_DN243_c0_g1_i1.p1  ORF type:complete len:113 (+),score=19.43 TRINITY_DN243_c0_g1_i1:198-536(+)
MPRQDSAKPVRLYSKGKVLGARRSHHRQYPQWSLVQIEGVNNKEDTQFYLGKRVAYVYKANTLKNDRKGRVIWGRIATAHGNSGVVRAKFRNNLPPKAEGATVRIMMYPSNI